MSWWEYVTKHAHGDSLNQIAREMNVHASTVMRWKPSDDPKAKQPTPPKAESVLAFADAYGRPRREALHAAYLSDEERAAAMTDQEYIAYLEQRLKR